MMKTIRLISLGMTIIIFCLFSMLTYAEEKPLSEEELLERKPLSEEEILKWMEQYVPLSLAGLKDLKKENPRAYEEELRWIAEKIEHFEHVKKNYPEMFDRLVKAENLEVESWKIAEKIRRTRDTETKKQLTAQLRNILGEIFEIRLEERMLEIKTLEKEIQEMKALIEKRKAKKEAIIDRHLKEMIPPDDVTLEWW